MCPILNTVDPMKTSQMRHNLEIQPTARTPRIVYRYITNCIDIQAVVVKTWILLWCFVRIETVLEQHISPGFRHMASIYTYDIITHNLH
jgi:hypothetical protein